MPQTTVYNKTTPAVPGQMMLGNQDCFSPVAYLAKTTLKVGYFCFLGRSEDQNTAVNAGTEEISSGPMLGIVPHTLAYAHPTAAASDVVPVNAYVTPFVNGPIAVKNEGKSAVHCGMRCGADKATGRPTFYGGSTVPEGVAGSAFRVVKIYDQGAPGSMVIISNQTPNS